MAQRVQRRPYRPAAYEQLINSLRQPNRYTHAALYPQPPLLIGRRARVFKLPEGYLLLARSPHAHAPELIRLQERPLQLRFFILTFDHARNRIRLQASKRYWRQSLAYVNDVCTGQYWRQHINGRSVEKTPEAVLAAVNNVTRDLWEIDRHAFVYPEMRRAWDKKVRKTLMLWLTSVARLSLHDAKGLTRARLATWYRWRNRRTPWKTSNRAHHAPLTGRTQQQ